MKKIVLAVLVAGALYAGLGGNGLLRGFGPKPSPPAGTAAVTGNSPAVSPSTSTSTSTAPSTGNTAAGAAFTSQKSGEQVTGDGVVAKLLADDAEGSRHQRFILALPSGQTLLVAHNIDLAPRIDTLKPGDAVGFNGVYEWNAKGGVLHWTHHDPAGRHQPGWLKHAGKTYE
jgi:hypothetical protein